METKKLEKQTKEKTQITLSELEWDRSEGFVGKIVLHLQISDDKAQKIAETFALLN